MVSKQANEGSVVVNIKDRGNGGVAAVVWGEQLPASGAGDRIVLDAASATMEDGTRTTAAESTTVTAAKTAAPKFRMHFVDWVRVFLTVAVLTHHTVLFYSEGLGETGLYPETPMDFATYMFEFVICGINQAYFMGLFFLLAGTFSTGSFNRKGAWQYISDRAVRLLVPVVVYDLLIAPIIYCIAQSAAAPDRPPGLASTSNVWLWYFKQYKRLGSNPTWFLVALFLFDCGYLAFRLAMAYPAQHKPNSCAARLQQKLVTRPLAAQDAKHCPYDNLYFVGALTGLILVLTVVAFVLRIWFPITWVTPYGVAFKLGYFGQYVIAYGLGVFAHLDNALMRMPRNLGYGCLLAAVIWQTVGWVLLAVITGVLQASENDKVTALQTAFTYIIGGIRPQALYMAFFEESFAVLWSVGVMVFARENVNIKPNRFGVIVIGAAYAVYIIHPLVLTCYGRAFLTVPIHNIAKMLIVVVLLNITTWLLGAALKAIPYADRVL